MTPWYRFLTDLGDRGGETAIRSIRRAALAVRANNVLLPEQKSADVLMYVHSNRHGNVITYLRKLCSQTSCRNKTVITKMCVFIFNT